MWLNRTLITGMVFCLCLLTTRNALAQLGSDFTRTSEIPKGGNTNHERLKTQAELAYKQGKYEKTIDLTNAVLKENANDHVAYYLRGSARIEVGKIHRDSRHIRQGIADAREAITYGGQSRIIYYLPYLHGMAQLADVEKRVAHLDVALKVANDVIALATLKTDDKANLLYQRGLIKVQMKDYEGAIYDYDQAIQYKADHLGSYIGRADAYVAAGKLDKAAESFDAAVQKFPKYPLVYNNRGRFLLDQGKADEAIQSFTQASQVDPGYFIALTNRAFAFMEQGDGYSAEQDLNRSLTINPQQPLALSLRGEAYLAQGNIEKAIKDYQAVVDLDPNSPIAHADLGFAQFFNQDRKAALASFQQAMDLNTDLQFLRPWHYLAAQSGNGALPAGAAEPADVDISKERWPIKVMVFLTGSISEQKLLESVKQDDLKLKKAQTCEAHFFIGQQALMAGQDKKAREHFQLAVQTKANRLSAYRGAKFALRQMVAANK